MVLGACLEVSLERQKNAPLKAEARLTAWKGTLEDEGHAARVHGPTISKTGISLGQWFSNGCRLTEFPRRLTEPVDREAEL